MVHIVPAIALVDPQCVSRTKLNDPRILPRSSRVVAHAVMRSTSASTPLCTPVAVPSTMRKSSDVLPVTASILAGAGDDHAIAFGSNALGAVLEPVSVNKPL